MKNWIISIILILSLMLLCGCTVGGTGTDAAESSPVSSGITEPPVEWPQDAPNAELFLSEDAYSFTPLPTPEQGGIYGNFLRCTDERIYINVNPSDRETQKPMIAVFDRSGIPLETIPYSIPYDEHEINGYVTVTEAGNILAVTYYAQSTDGKVPPSGRIILADTSGKRLYEATVPGVGPNRNVLLCRDGSVVVVGSDGIYRYDQTLSLTGEIPCTQAGALTETADGTLLAASVYAGQYFRLDFSSGQYTQEEQYIAPAEIDAAYSVHFPLDDDIAACLYADERGLWKNAPSNAVDLLCDWQKSGLKYNNLKIHAVWNTSHLLVSRTDGITNQRTVGLLSNDTVSNAEKRRITLGLTDDLQKRGFHQNYDLLMNAIDTFNAESGDYFVEVLTLTDSVQSDSDASLLPDAFRQAMLDGDAPDIIVSTEDQRFSMSDFSDKQAFLDLAPYVEHALLPGVVSAYTTNGALFSVPFDIRLETLFARGDLLTEDVSLSLDALYQLSNDLPGRIALFNDCANTLKTSLLQTALPSFADKASKECSFDSEAFARALMFVENVDAVCSEHAETRIYVENTGSYYFMTDDVTFLSDSCALYAYPLYNIQSYFLGKQIMGDAAVIRGYPVNGGERICLNSDFDMFINDASDVKYGALSFLTFLLSDRVQCSSVMRNSFFPITKSALENLIDMLGDTMYFSSPVFVPFENAGYHYTVYSRSVGYRPQNGESVTAVPVSDADRAAIRALFYRNDMQSLTDTTMTAILEEELSAYRAGIRSLEETQNILQSRLWIYINE